MQARPLSLVLFATIACAFACSDSRESAAREHLVQRIGAESNGALTLASLTKTNGFDHVREGMNLYTFEWQATVHVQADGWKAGWRDYQILSAEPSTFAAAVEGLSVRRLLKGATVVLQGKSEMQKADRGWRVLDSSVTAFKINLPPEVAGFIGTWHIPARDLFFRIKNDESRGLRHSVASFNSDGRVSWVNARPARLENGALVVQYEEGSDTITKVSQNELLSNEEDAFGRTPQKAVRIEGEPDRVMAAARTSVQPSAGQLTQESPEQAATPLSRDTRIGQWAVPDQLAFLAERRIGTQEISGLNKAELKCLRNFIYARHGRAFTSPDLRQFFEQQPWYRVNPQYSDSMLSPIEVANAATISTLEKARP